MANPFLANSCTRPLICVDDLGSLGGRQSFGIHIGLVDCVLFAPACLSSGIRLSFQKIFLRAAAIIGHCV